MPASEFGYVYWLFDEHCIDVERDGYVGACKRLDVRLRAHQRYFGTYKGAVGVPSDFKCKILFTGPIADCRALELKLRPSRNIGWNREFGGKQSALGHKHGKAFRKLQAAAASERFRGAPKSLEHRAKQSAAALRRYADPAEHLRTSKAVKRGIKNRDQSGANNPMFGRQMSEATKEKIRAKIKERGISGPTNPNYRHGKYC